jgi:uncharacterized membrane protein
MAKQQSNANIVALGFDSQDGAENMLANVHTWQERGFFTVKDAVVVTRGAGNNQLEIKQTVKKTGKWALGGGGIGFLAGMLLGGPVGGLVVGATVGAISGALKDSGIDDKFIRQMADGLRGDSSALFVMVEPNPNRDEGEVFKELSEQRATVLSTTLAPEREQQLRALLAGKGGVAPASQRAPEPAAPPSEPLAASSDAGADVATAISMDATADTTTDIGMANSMDDSVDGDADVNTDATADASMYASTNTSMDAGRRKSQ